MEEHFKRISLLKFKSNEELEAKIDAYFEECKEKKKPLTITGLALALDTNRTTLLEYEGEIEGKEKSSLSKEVQEAMANTIKKAKLMCENFAEEFLFTGGKSIVGAIFNLKNNYKWRDKTEVGLESPIGGLEIKIIEPKK